MLLGGGKMAREARRKFFDTTQSFPILYNFWWNKIPVTSYFSFPKKGRGENLSKRDGRKPPFLPSLFFFFSSPLPFLGKEKYDVIRNHVPRKLYDIGKEMIVSLRSLVFSKFYNFFNGYWFFKMFDLIYCRYSFVSYIIPININFTN